ncbi:tRNA N(3)-methylcytidine methyltransferase METTL6 [Diorhabda sublineata]|uniref:tRNA N(3)-methylcytidine methyltransferase METTL6 n=1 Tax=Diorhabda sublineata TaxID=1163346 RepID=UPI0024E14E62|nr:tRNA N(3)-methylcytidine methyltransferase METTL6 [Diorhabda sublineata]
MEDDFSEHSKTLSPADKEKLEIQNSRLISEHKAKMLELEARKHWDLFYKRNENRFFKDRHWTTREFQDLINDAGTSKRILFEIGCGVGNFIFPLLEEKLNFDVIACDFSSKAVEILKNDPKYDPNSIKAFQCDITTPDVFSIIPINNVDIATLIFVLSAIHPNNFHQTLRNIYDLLKPGGVLLFRDYGLYDMAQLRFKAGHKISDNFYMRQDGTRSYYFSVDYIGSLLKKSGFEVISNCYIHRRTVNRKDNIDVPRIFVQCKAVKPFG